MEIDFKTKKLEKIMNSERELSRTYGENSRLIMRRLNVLDAAPSLEDVPHTPPDRRHELGGDRKHQYAVDLKHPQRLIFEVHSNPLPLRDDGGVDLSKVTAITIIAVEDYHK